MVCVRSQARVAAAIAIRRLLGKAFVNAAQCIGESLRGILGEHPSGIEVPGSHPAFDCRMSSQMRLTASGMVSNKLASFKNILRNAHACAQHLGLGKTSFENGMRSSLPPGTDEAQIQQIIETIELGAVQDVGGEIIPLKFATNEKTHARRRLSIGGAANDAAGLQGERRRGVPLRGLVARFPRTRPAPFATSAGQVQG